MAWGSLRRHPEARSHVIVAVNDHHHGAWNKDCFHTDPTPGSSSPDPRGHKVLRPRSQPRTRTSQRNCTERRALSLDWHRVAAAASTRGKSATTRTTTTDEDSSSIAPCATHRSPALSKPVWTRRDHWKPPPPPSRTSKNCGRKSASSSVDSGVIDQPLSRPAPPPPPWLS